MAAPPRIAARPEDLAPTFEALTGALREHRQLWTARPFAYLRLPWEDEFGEVAAWLRGLDSDVVHQIDQDITALPAEAPAALRAWASAAAAPLPRLESRPLPALETKRLATRVPARKWAQVRAFLAAAAPRWPAETARVVDWCAGKGHLGRAAALCEGLPVTLLERRADLCTTGAALAAFFGAEGCRFEAVDVLEGGRAHLGPRAVGLGLHACGILWRTLLSDAADTDAAAVVAPCCYHNLGGAKVYTPQSAAGAAAQLPLEQHHLRLAMAEEKVARPAIRKARRREQAWRLGLDLLVREATGEDRYRPLGGFSHDLLRLDFEAFCYATAERLQVPLPPRWNAEAARKAGEARAKEVFALAQVRGLFRRTLEVWLILDAAMAALEAGRRVELGTFCEPALTPRNVMLVSSPG